RELEPDLHISDGMQEAVWTRGEGYVEVVPFVGALLAHAVRHGARVMPGQRVTGVLRSGGRVRGVVTESGTRFEADVVVDCAGPAMDDLARLAAVGIPLGRVPRRRIPTSPGAT